MKLKIKQDFILGKAQDKGKVMLYTLLDSNLNKFSAIGEKAEGLKEMSKVTVEMDVNMKSERYELKDGKIEFINTANVFITSVIPVGE